MTISDSGPRNVMLTGGWAHDFARTAPVLADILFDVAGVRTEIIDNPESFGERLGAGDFALATVYACWFRMLDARYSPDQRAEFARRTPPAVAKAMEDHVAAGGALLAMHTAPVCFDDWERWPAILGGGWSWERSWHPPPQEMSVQLCPGHRLTDGLDDFMVDDERYTALEVSSAATVLATSPSDHGDQPILWCHESAGGRVVYDSLGHDARALAHPGHVRLLGRCVRWLLSLEEEKPGA